MTQKQKPAASLADVEKILRGQEAENPQTRPESIAGFAARLHREGSTDPADIRARMPVLLKLHPSSRIPQDQLHLYPRTPKDGPVSAADKLAKANAASYREQELKEFAERERLRRFAMGLGGEE